MWSNKDNFYCFKARAIKINFPEVEITLLKKVEVDAKLIEDICTWCKKTTILNDELAEMNHAEIF